MIKIVIYKNSQGKIFGFKADDHGDPIVCSAVSALTLNAINSIERFTDEELICDYDEDGGFLYFEMPRIKDGEYNEAANLLMESMLLGLKSFEDEYSKHICISYEEV